MKTNSNNPQTHSFESNGKKLTWEVEKLWVLASELKPFDFSIADFDGFDEDCWFGDRYKPTVNRVLEHCKKISAADYSYPIILSEDNIVMDGIHRICKAHLEGKATIKAVKFSQNPLPDKIEETARDITQN